MFFYIKYKKLKREKEELLKKYKDLENEKDNLTSTNKDLKESFDNIKSTVDSNSEIEKIDENEIDENLKKGYFNFTLFIALVCWLVAVILHGTFRNQFIDSTAVTYLIFTFTFVYEPFYKIKVRNKYSSAQYDKFFSHKLNSMKLTLSVLLPIFLIIYFVLISALDKMTPCPWIYSIF